MSTAIGKAALVLTTDAAGARAGLDDFKADATKIASQTAENVKGSFSFFKAGLFSGAGAAIGSKLVDWAGAAIGSFGDLAQRIDDAGDAAKRLGIGVGELQGLQWAAKLAGTEVTQLDAGLGKFRRQVAGPLDEALFQFAKNLEAIEDPGERAQALFDAFGKAGPQMALMFENGADGLKAMVQEAKDLGIAVSDVDADAIGNANDAMDRAKKALEGLQTRAVLALAPVFEFVAGKFTAAMKALQPLFDRLREGFTAIWDIASAVLDEVWGAIKSVVTAVGEWVGSITGLGETTWTIKDVIVGAFRAVGTAGALAWDTIKLGAGAVAVAVSFVIDGFGVLVDALREVVSLAKELPDEIRPDWVDDMAAGIDRFASKVHGTGESLRKWGTDAVTGWGNSAVKFNKWLDGVANKTKDEVKKAAREAVEAAEEVQAAITKFDNASLIQGTSAEVSARLRHEFGGQVAQERMLEEQKKGNATLKDINAGIKRLPKKPAAEIAEM